MKIGILITSISNFGQKGYYNSQEIGLAKALSDLYDEVFVYKLVPFNLEIRSEKIGNNDKASIYFIPSKQFGINGVINTAFLHKSMNALIHFSDTQFSVPDVYKWCKKTNIRYIPYIGVVKSHSSSKIKQLVTNVMFKRNLSVYKKCLCCVKTPAVQKEIEKLGVSNTIVTPVGIDIDLLKENYENVTISDLKIKYGFKESSKIILFIGRMSSEKQPIHMVESFSKIVKKDTNNILLMVGTGELKADVLEKVKKLNIEQYVKIIERIPNSDIWELYCMADVFVNLNQQEIFGMAILEAMYYKCKVVAWEAPGPNFIIENDISGCLVSCDSELINKILDDTKYARESKDRIEKKFTWLNMSSQLFDLLS